MTRLVLHVGTHKTGTTSLQHVLQANNALLRERGIVFPLLDGNPAYAPRNHSSLAWATTQADPDEVVPDQWASVQERVRREQPGVVVLVGEQLCRLRPASWTAVRRTLEAIGFESVQVICYLRRQDSCFTSMYVQWVKSGRSASPFQELWRAYTDHRFFRYDRLHEQLTRHLTPDTASFRAFERGQFVNGSLLDDFLDTAALDIEAGDLTDTGAELNESPGATSIRLMLLASATAEAMGVRGHDLRMAYRKIRKLVPRFVENDPRFVGWLNWQAEQFMAGYDPWNRALASQLFDRDELFLERPAWPLQRQPVPLSADALEEYSREVRAILGEHL